MVTNSSNRGLQVPTVGGDAGTWGNELNTTIGYLDQILGGSITFQSSGSATVTLTSSETEYGRIVFVGTPGSSMVLNFSSSVALGNYGVWNATSTSANGGVGFNILCQVTSTSTGSTVLLPVGNMRQVNVDGQNVQYTDQVVIPTVTLPPVLNGYLYGLTLSNNSSVVLNFAAGIAADSSAVTYMQSAAAFTKSASGVWASGSAGPGMGTGLSFTAGTDYHVFIISNGASSGIDFYFDTSVTAANKPANTNYWRRIMSMNTLSSVASWRTFSQNGDDISIAPVIDISSNATFASPTLKTLTVPSGIEVWANFNGSIVSDATHGQAITFSDADSSGIKCDGSNNMSLYAQPAAGGVTTSAGQFSIRTNASKQIYVSANLNTGGYSIVTYGWLDRRGQDVVP